jgi:polygalacturonase
MPASNLERGATMMDKTQRFDRSKRQAFRKILGLGTGLATANLLTPSHASALGMNIGVEPAQNPAAPFTGIYYVRGFGARGDGKTVDTPAINRAIEAAAADGGGTVRFPAGTYLCYSIHLKSKVDLYLDQGATILAAETGEQGSYDPAEPNPWDKYQDFGHSHWHNALMWGEGISNVSIQGPGLMWGKGLTRGRGETGAGVGDKTISLKNCHNITIRDISVLHGGHFAILATGVDNLTIDNVMLDTNRDGVDIDCCHNVRVSNCTVNSPWDDGICPKSSYGLGYARATENLTITNCFVTGGYEEGTVLDGTWKEFQPGVRVPRTGRIKCGTESNGGFKNITISNCVFEKCQGLAIETVDGALAEDISITNITMRDIANCPIFLRLGSRMRGPAGVPVGKLRRVNISDIVVSNTAARYASIISGIPDHNVEDVRVSNITVLHPGGGTREDAALVPPEKENAYPEPTMFGSMPAYGFYIRHTARIELNHIDVRYEKEDLRPPFVLEEVEEADFLHIKAQQAAGVPSFALKNVTDFSTYLSRPVRDIYLKNVTQETL